MVDFFVKGVIIGFAIAAPIGPIAVLCIQRALQGGLKIGVMTGLGAALADGTYGLFAGLGLTALSSFIVKYQFWARTIGGLFLLYLGANLLLRPPQAQPKTNVNQPAWRALGAAFLLTMANPATILSFVAVFAGLSVGAETVKPSYAYAWTFALAVTIGSGAWWLLLTSSVALILHHRLSPNTIKGINRLSGIVIGAFGLIALSAGLLPH